MTLDVVLVAALVLTAVAAVMAPRLLHAVIGLAVSSGVLAIIMFRLHAPLAAVFELSVCAGLIPAIFLSAISLTRRLTPDAVQSRRQEKLKLYWALPMLLLLAGIALSQIRPPEAAARRHPAATGASNDVRRVLWQERRTDLLGQVLVLLAGALGVAILIKELRHDR